MLSKKYHLSKKNDFKRVFKEGKYYRQSFLDLKITENNFEKEVVKHKGIIIIDNWAKWCQPCLRAAPIFEELSKEMKSIRFAKLNVEEFLQLAESSHISAR